MSTDRIILYTDQIPVNSVWNCIASPQDHVNHEHEAYEKDIVRTWTLPGFQYHAEYRRDDPYRKGRRDWKDFDHYKAFRSQAISGMTQITHIAGDFYPHYWGSNALSGRVGCQNANPWEDSPFGEPNMPLNGMHDPFYVDQPDGGFIPDPLNLDDLIARGLKTMLPEVKQELSLINSILELKDFKSLPKSIKRLANEFTGVFNPRGRATLRSLFRGGADGYLQYAFNISPLLSDIKGMYNALAKLEARINRLLSEAGKPRTHHWSWTWQEYPDGREDSSQYAGLPSFGTGFSGPSVKDQLHTFHLTRIVRGAPSVFHVEVEFNYNYTQYQREHARLLALLDGVGINFDPKIIWNAIPWSFVVDWVLNVSSWLDQFKVQHMEPQINIRRCLWSVKRMRNVYFEKTQSFNDALHPQPPHTVTLPAVKETSYKRRVFMPSLSQLQVGGLSSNEVTLGAALVLSRSRRRSKRR